MFVIKIKERMITRLTHHNCPRGYFLTLILSAKGKYNSIISQA